MNNTLNIPTSIRGIEVVQDIKKAVAKVLKGTEIARFEFGSSMTPILFNGEFYRAKPIKDKSEVQIGDAVLCCVNGYYMTHMVLEERGEGKDKEFLIASTNGATYGWTKRVYAIALPFGIEREEREFIQNYQPTN